MRVGALHEPGPDAGATRRGAHRDAADLGGSVMLQQAQRADDPIIPDGDQVGGAGIEFVQLELARHPLLVHEHFEAQRRMRPA